MSGEPARMGELILAYLVQLAFVLPVALITLWLLRTRWLVHTASAMRRSAVPWRQVSIGALTAVAALALAVLPGVLAGSYSAGATAVQYRYMVLPDAYDNAGGLALLFGLQSLFEEALFRGIGVALLAMLLMKVAEVLYCQSAMWRFGTAMRSYEEPELLLWRRRAWLWSGLLANVALSLGFALMHSRNPNISPIALVNIVLAGLWLGLLFWRHVSLVAATAAHFAWNFGLALLGLPISGFAMVRAPLGAGISGAHYDLLSGGAFGPEASLPCTFAFGLLCALLAIDILRAARAQEQTAAPTSSDSDTAELQAG